uniref:Cytochrome p450 n=1 Tax=Moniliophthora roreri TaxID=221103 RepID=A0A0W0FKH2_MONRR
MLLTSTIILSGIIVLISRWLLQRRRDTAVLNKIPGPRSTSWVKGHLGELNSPHSWEYHEMMESIGPTVTYPSWFGSRTLYTFDLKAMHYILVKDSASWEFGTGFLYLNKLLFGPGLLSNPGEIHRRQRKQLTPVFSIAHMRGMVPIFTQLRGTIAKKIEMLSWLSRTAFELIGQSGLGTSFDTLSDDEGAHPFSGIVKELSPYFSRAAVWADPLPWIMKIGSASFRHFIVQKVPWSIFTDGEKIAYYMWDVSKEIYLEKKRALEAGEEAVKEQLTRGKDILSILMNENTKVNADNRLNEDEILAQYSYYPSIRLVLSYCNHARTIMFAAMDTTSSALARTLDVLSKHADVQNKLRQEILEARRNNDGKDLNYDQLVNMPYLDAICRETLRLYAPVIRSVRTSTRDTVIPLATPMTGTDGNLISEIPVPKGTDVYVSLIGSNRSSEIWGPDAGDWKPERWLAPLPSTVTDARIPGVYSNLMTFNAGSRSCIGFKFSQLEMKVVLAFLIESFEFSPTGKEIVFELTSVVSPAVKGEPGHQLPLRVAALKKA